MGLLDQWRTRKESDPGTLPLSVEEVGEVLGRPVTGRLKILGGMTSATYYDAADGARLLEVQVVRGRMAKVSWMGYKGSGRITWTTSEMYVNEYDEYGALKDDVLVTLKVVAGRSFTTSQAQLVPLLETAVRRVTS